jgi:ribA/ribD-fused uncharacterized protein
MSIGPFRDEYRWLSNFWESPTVIMGHTYPTTEHFYQAMKCANGMDRHEILMTETPGRAKRLGAAAAIRPDWDEIKVATMRIATFSKFSQNRELAEKLLATNDQVLIEFNHWHDNFWGYCTCDECQGKDHLNNLGEILSDVREHLNRRSRGALFI